MFYAFSIKIVKNFFSGKLSEYTLVELKILSDIKEERDYFTSTLIGQVLKIKDKYYTIKAIESFAKKYISKNDSFYLFTQIK